MGTKQAYYRCLAVLSCLLCFLLPYSVLAQQGQQPPPAVNTELSQRGVSLKVQMIGPQKGLLSNLTDLLRTEDYARVLNNLQQTKRGVWTSRGIGITKHRANAFNGGATISEMALHTKSDGTQLFLFQCGSKFYKYDLASTTETELKTGLSTTYTPCIRSYIFADYSLNEFVVTNGVDQPQFYDVTGSTWYDGAAAGWPVTVSGVSYSKPRYSEFFAGRQLYAGFPSRPFTVLFSQFGNLNAFPVNSPLLATDAGAITLPAALGPITGMRPMLLGNDTADQVLIVGCQNGIAMITGTSALNFASKELTRQFGVVSNRTWVALDNDMWFLASDGLRQYSTVSLSSTLVSAAPMSGIQDLQNRINKTYASDAWAVYYPPTRELQLWLPADSETKNGHAIILSFDKDDPQAPPLASTKSGITVSCGLYDPVTKILYGGSYTGAGVGEGGYLYKHYTGDDYDGTAIAWDYVPAMVGGNSPAQAASARKFVIVTDGGDQKFTAEAYNLTQRVDGLTTWVVGDTKSFNFTSPSLTDISTWASGTTTSYPKFIDFEPRGNGRFWSLRLRGTTSGDHINLVGVLSILTVGGWKQ